MLAGIKRTSSPALAAVTAVTVVLVGSACGGDNGNGGSEEGGVVTMATWSATTSLDPTQVAGTGNSSGAELAALYDTIMRYDPDTGAYEPHTAESLTPNDDFTQWTLTLRDGISFSDGTPYDAEAVVANLQRHVEARSNAVSLVTPITDYDVTDPLTVVFTLAFPWNGFPFALASGPGMVVSPTAVETLGDQLGTNPEGAGAGPFVIDEFRPDESVTLTRNPEYWGGEVPLEGLRFIHAGTGTQTYESFRSGAVDAAFLRDAAAMADATAEGAGGYTVHYSANDTLIMNNGLTVVCQDGEPAPRCADQEDGTELPPTTPTADPRVRQAVAAAIDLDTLNARVWDGNGEMSSALIAPQSRWYADVNGPQYDVARAQALVDEVKAEGEWDGTVRVSCHTGLPTWGTAVQGMLEAAGFQVELTDQQEIAANTSAVIIRRDFDIACFGASISDAEPLFALNRDFNSSFVGAGGGNYAGYENPAVDEAIAAGRGADNEADIQAAVTTIAQAYAQDVPFLALTAQPEMVLLTDDLQGTVLGANTVVMFHQASRG